MGTGLEDVAALSARYIARLNAFPVLASGFCSAYVCFVHTVACKPEQGLDCKLLGRLRFPVVLVRSRPLSGVAMRR